MSNLQKLLIRYEKAAYDLCNERDRLFPVGAKVLSKFTGLRATVINGSLYPDQVNTTLGHCSPNALEVTND